MEKRAFTARTSGQLSIVIVPIIMVSIATVSVVLRFYARRLNKASLWLDDWLILVALILTWIFQGVNMAAVFAGGLALPLLEIMAIDPNIFATFYQLILSNFIIWAVTVSVVQLAILFFYIRVFGVKVIFRRIAYALVGLVICYAIISTIPEILSCIPVSKQWNPLEPGTCIDSNSYCSAVGLIHVIFDLAIVILPIPLVWKLHTSHENKIVLTVLLCLGLVATAISLIKTVCLFNLSGVPMEDVTDYLWPTVLLQTIELPIGIVCCCVPCLAPVWKQVSPTLSSFAQRLLSRSRGSSMGTSNFNSKPNDSTGGDESSFRQGLVSNSKFSRLSDESKRTRQNKTTARGRHEALDVELDGMEAGINVTRAWTVER